MERKFLRLGLMFASRLGHPASRSSPVVVLAAVVPVITCDANPFANLDAAHFESGGPIGTELQNIHHKSSFCTSYAYPAGRDAADLAYAIQHNAVIGKRTVEESHRIDNPIYTSPHDMFSCEIPYVEQSTRQADQLNYLWTTIHLSKIRILSTTW